jgi:hypothetical protein
MTSKIHSISLEIEKMIEIIEEYNLYNVGDNDSKIYKINNLPSKKEVFKTINDDKTSYNIFFNNIQIRVEISKTEKVYSIHLKRSDENWEFNNYDFSHPTTNTLRIFVSYDIPVLNITRASGDIYVHGNWDKYVYKNLNFLNKIFENCTTYNQFNTHYL